MNRPLPPLFAALHVDPQAAEPLYRQLYHEIRAAILSGRLSPGSRLPSTRDLARNLGIARTTVVSAFEQLLAEGYLEGRIGAGSFVARDLPDALLTAPQAEPIPVQHRYPAAVRLSRRGDILAATAVSATRSALRQRPFQVGLPDLETFPFALWARLAARHYSNPQPALLDYGDPAGYRPLRAAIAGYLAQSRGVRCTAEQVIVIAGSQQGLDLAARLLLDPGDQVWIEDPGYIGARGAFQAAGANLVPVPVDHEGLDVASGMRRAPQARMAYITPSHQFPLGVTMSLARRLDLLHWAAESEAWVIEDDYDSEYRYGGRPLAALQGLDQAGRVIYLGTFSKVLFPGLRLGYLVVPPDLAPAVRSARALSDRSGPGLEQAILADFIAEGHFGRHIRRMRALYAARQTALLAAAEALRDRLEIVSAETGMHVVGLLPEGVDDREIAARAAAAGIIANPLSTYRLAAHPPAGLLLGYAGFRAEAITEGMARLGRVL